MIPLFKVKMSEGAIAKAVQVLSSGYIGQGPQVDEFERQLQPWFGSQQILATNSATSALHLALRLANIGPGDEVVTTPMTCAATAVPILERGAHIVWADIDPLTGNLDPSDVVKKCGPRTKAILAVHWAGYPCDLDELRSIAKEKGCVLIEDAAHAFGARYKGMPIGSHSDFVAFSFQAIKHLTTGDGGALTCAYFDDYKRGKLLRWYGIDREGARRDFRCEEDIVEYGYKFHMNDIAAGIGLGQLSEVQETLKRHRENADYYRENLSEAPGVKLLKRDSERISSDWLFTFRHPQRDELVKLLIENGIMASQVHTRIDRHTTFQRFQMELPGVDEFYQEQLNIPVGWWVSEKDREEIVKKVILCTQKIKKMSI